MRRLPDFSMNTSRCFVDACDRPWRHDAERVLRLHHFDRGLCGCEPHVREGAIADTSVWLGRWPALGLRFLRHISQQPPSTLTLSLDTQLRRLHVPLRAQG